MIIIVCFDICQFNLLLEAYNFQLIYCYSHLIKNGLLFELQKASIYPS